MRIEQAAAALKTDLERGLTGEERRRRLKKGLNLLDKSKSSAILVFLGQFADTMVIMLLAATLVSAILGEFADAVTIMVIVVLNACLGFVQEYKAERSLETLSGLTAPTAQIISAGVVKVVPAVQLTPGDIVLINAGDRAPADLHVFRSSNLEVDESPFTGESLPVAKDENDESPYVYMGCLITRGRSRGLVVATGMNTEMGNIARMLAKAEQQPTPLQKRLARLGNALVIACSATCLVVVAAGVLRGEPPYKMFMAGVSLAVAAIPEGLPAVVTLCLTFGLQRMLKRNAIARKLPAVETLGCATVICSDKTGTLTENRMTVEKIFIEGSVVNIDDRLPTLLKGRQSAGLRWLLTIGAVCNSAILQPDNGRFNVIGDPTDGALLLAAAKGGLTATALKERYEVLQEHPFESKRKMMAVVVRDGQSGRIYAFVKGAPEVILAQCASTIDPGQRSVLSSVSSRWAKQAYRLLAIAWKECPQQPQGWDQTTADLRFAGYLALSDPPRPQVAVAIKRCLQAGIKPIMITGDHRETAVAVADRIGLPYTRPGVVTGAEIEAMSDGELAAKVNSFAVCARVYPEHKMRIVRALKKQGHVVAMTGDGVNDAPAVKEADIGIAMGIAGTEVTKETASFVLVDDNFATIVAAVEEGRVIYSNIRKFIRFLLTCNTGEVFTMFFAIMLGLPLPLRAIQILWVNLVTDGLPALALSMEPGGAGIMEQPPRPKDESIMARGLGRDILTTGLLIGLLTIVVFAFSLRKGVLAYAQSMALATLISIQLLYALACRRDNGGKAAGIGANPWLIGSLILSFGLLFLVMYLAPLRAIFGTKALGGKDWLLVLSVSVLPLLISLGKRKIRAKNLKSPSVSDKIGKWE